MPNIENLFAEDGPLAEAIDGFKPRQAQVDMAVEIQSCIDNQKPLVVEAGTGTGKTYAYLVPALANKKKTIISTGTKNLQEQLFHRDLPKISQALDSRKRTALLKGRSNYLCLHRLKQHQLNSTLMDKQTLNEFAEVRKWSISTKSGDVGEITAIPEGAQVLPLVTSTADNCLGKDCPDYEDCYLVKARRKAMDADLVVVNHHLFFADMALKDTGFGELIPDADLIVFDEAHQIPDIASEYFGESLSSRQLMDLAKDIELLYRTVLKDADQLYRVAEKMKMVLQDLRLHFPHDPQKGNWVEAMVDTKVSGEVAKLREVLGVMYEVVKIHLGREKELDSIFERVSDARKLLDLLTDIGQQGVSLWYETTLRHLVLHLTPLSIADKFAGFIESPKRSWVFTSATLTVGDGFDHYTGQMGLWEAQTLALDSPFDYPQQAMLCVPRFLPEPSAPSMRDRLLTIAEQLIEASGGRCFLLFTSHAMLRTVAEQLQERIDNPILVQGTTSKGALLEDYLAKANAVLLGTGAFWEGVDVKGSDLTCVMIDKLPFASPDDPLLQARVEDCRKRGHNPFNQIQIPQAVIALKQGAGRLIRDSDDKGVLVICDHRLVSKGYAPTFISSLPPMYRTRDLPKALEFLTQINSEEDQCQ